MIYVTRNDAEALHMINNMPFEDHEKAELAGFLRVTNQFMREMKENKGMNSKGGEKWFASRLQERIQSGQMSLGALLEGMDEEAMARARFLGAQNACLLATIEIAKEFNASPELMRGLEEYVGFMRQIFLKYTKKDQDV